MAADYHLFDSTRGSLTLAHTPADSGFDHQCDRYSPHHISEARVCIQRVLRINVAKTARIIIKVSI